MRTRKISKMKAADLYPNLQKSAASLLKIPVHFSILPKLKLACQNTIFFWI